MTDFLLLEQLHKMIKENTKPRLMFRKGVSARGFFRPYMSMSEYTRASIFRSLDEITPVTVRFSSMLGDKGTADTVRNIKGMAVKFRTEENTYDMICHSLPVLFINDERKLLQMVDALTRREPFDGVCSTKFWRFVTENPEAINGAIRFYSGEGLSDSFVNMKWYSVNNAFWVNGKREKFLVRYRWMPVMEEESLQRIKEKRLGRNAAEFMAGYDPDRAGNELARCISEGCFPTFELQIQMKFDAMEQELSDGSDIHRMTLLWDERECPYLSVGILKLTQLPEDYRAECEMLSFAPGNTIDGIETCHDTLSKIIDHIYKTDALERGGLL